DGSRAAGTGRGDRLPVGAVNQVPRCEHTRNAGAGGGVLDLHVALVVDVELVADQLAPRVVADGDEQPGDVQLGFLTGHGVPQLQPAHRALALDLGDHGVGAPLDLGVGPGPLQHDLGGAELVAAVDDRHRLG